MNIDKIILISGIPRSGTTLCCHVLNKQRSIVALHEPINPESLNIYRDNASAVISFETKKLYDAVQHGLPFEHGDAGGLDISNPIGLEKDISSGKRQQTASRGKVILNDYVEKTFTLVVKQNALFTAYLNELTLKFNIICIIRNPVDVLLSWWTVDLPIGNGRIPAGENNDLSLKRRLKNLTEIRRQFVIYEWFCERYYKNNANVLKYEELISSGGQQLFDKMKLQNATTEALTLQNRTFSDDILEKLHKYKLDIIHVNTKGYYSTKQIADRIDEVLNSH